MNRSKILVVDDEVPFLLAVEAVLESDYDVRTCLMPQEALRAVEAFSPDLVLLDIHMPGMTGFELMDRLRKRAPDLGVIMVTGSSAELDDSLVESIKKGAFYFVQKPVEREVLLTLVGRYFERRRLIARLEESLREARRFQQSLLPGAGLRVGRASLAARYLPCDALGGDLYDFVSTRSGDLAFMLADVCGHGPSAAMWAGVLKSAFHAARTAEYEPMAVVREMQRGIASLGGYKFVTVICGLLRADQQRLELVNAGHPPALYAAPGSPPREVNGPGSLLMPTPLPGRMRPMPFHLDLAPGDRLLLYTDGIFEASGPRGAYGEERLHALLGASAGRGDALLDEILGAVEGFCGGAPADDDRTLLTLTID